MRFNEIQEGEIYQVETHGYSVPMRCVRVGEFTDHVYSRGRDYLGHKTTKKGALMQPLDRKTLEPQTRRTRVPAKTINGPMGAVITVDEETWEDTVAPANWIPSRDVKGTWDAYVDATQTQAGRAARLDASLKATEAKALEQFGVRVYFNRETREYNRHYASAGTCTISVSDLEKLMAR